jgi:hypothetical protein
MIRRFRHGPLALAALAMLATGVTSAQPARSADPADPRAEVPPLRHASALDRYKRLSAEPPQDWRAAHETVARIGGWRAYLREANAPEPAASAPAGGAPHHRHGGGPR